MTKEEFKKLYNNFKSNCSTSDFDEFNQKWRAYKDKMSNEDLPLAASDPNISWTKFNENDTKYLLRFIEWDPLFGKAKGGSSKQYMIYHHFGKEKDGTPDKDYSKYYDGYKDKYCKDEKEVLGDYNDKICRLLKQIVKSTTIDDLKTIENDIKKGAERRFDAKQIIKKLVVLHFALDNIASNTESKTGKLDNNSLLWIYKDEAVDNLYELFFGKVGDQTFFKKSHEVWEAAVNLFNDCIGADYINESKIEFEKINDKTYAQNARLNDFLWTLATAKGDGLINFDVPNVIYHGAPGTGKTYTTLQTVKLLCQGDDSRYKYCQFHPSYSYQDFIEGIKPMGIVDGNVNLEVVNGIFKQFCIDVKKKNEDDYVKYGTNYDKYPHYYFIVDEINRGDLSRIFGETFSLLEPDYRDKDFSGSYSKTDNLIVTPLSNVIEQRINDKNEDKSDDAEKNKDIAYKIIGGKVYFGIPFNIHFIGLMNDVDKSIDTFDLALRRRFKWITKECDYGVIKDAILEKWPNLFEKVNDYIESCEELNKFIIKPEGLGLSKNYQLGQSYFMKIINLLKRNQISKKAKEEVFTNYIETTLREYAREVCDENEIDDKIKEAKKAFGIEEDKNTNNDEE